MKHKNVNKLNLYFKLILLQGALCACLNTLNAQADSIINYLCSENTFWTLNSWGEIHEWQLNNNAISGGQVVADSSSANSLSYCGTGNNQTFFGGTVGGITYYNAPNWNFISNSNLNYCNSGGYKQFQYYMSGSSLYYFTGTSLNYLFNANFQIADLAVDSLARVWYVITDFSNNAYLKCADSLGNILNTYTFPSVTSLANAYGMFLMNDTIYVGFGHNNTVYTGKIVPIIINGSSFSFGQAINFPEQQSPIYLDMASCTGRINKPFGIKSTPNLFTSFFPNPCKDELNINYANHSGIEIYSLVGEKIYSFPPGVKLIDLSSFEEGIYTIKILMGKNSTPQKLIIAR